MYWLVALVSLGVIGIICLGVYYEIHPVRGGTRAKIRLKSIITSNLAVYITATLGVLIFGIQNVMAATETASGGLDVSVGLGLTLIGIGLPTALAAIGSGIAVSSVGAASLALISEKPEMFGRTLIYLGLAEGIAIYGLVVTILLLGKI